MSDEAGEYSSARVRRTVWGESSEVLDGSWETVWRLVFSAAQQVGDLEIYRDEDIGFVALLRILEGGSGELLISTRRWSMSAEYYSPTFTSFGIVNDSVAEIATIQGCPRNWYAPFRGR